MSRFPEFLKPPRHGKWREANLAAPLKAWKRFPAAQDWLDRNGPAAASMRTTATGSVIDPELARQQAARTAPGNAGEQEKLFQRFLELSLQQKQ